MAVGLTVRASLENVIGKVAKEALQEMLSSLDKEYRDILATIEAEERESASKVAEILRGGDRQAETIKRRIISRAELDARNRSIRLLEEAVNRVFEESLKVFERQSLGKRYKKALMRLLEEGVEAIGAGEVVVAGSSRDRDALRKAAYTVEKSRGVKITVSRKPLNCIGGVYITSVDGSMIYDNTVEARLERLKPLLRKEIFDMMLKGD